MAKLLTEEQYNELIARLERAERRADVAANALGRIATYHWAFVPDAAECWVIATEALATVKELEHG